MEDKSEIVIFAIMLLVAIGWIMNVGKIFLSETGFEAIVRICGIFMIPLGAILGYI